MSNVACRNFSELPKKKYRVILADPNWKFETFSKKGLGKSPERQYVTTPTQEIANLPINELVHPDGAVLFMWVTWPHIFSAQEVLKGWGFQYSGLAWEWIKRNPVTGKFQMGGGYGTRSNLEPCILARTPNFKLVKNLKNRKTRDFIFAERREHSRKPDVQYKLIEDLFDGPYLELYGRQRWPGWDVGGYEYDKFDVNPDHYEKIMKNTNPHGIFYLT